LPIIVIVVSPAAIYLPLISQFSETYLLVESLL